ncbi:hypothetical protein EJB05_43639, partial [Eragrostis curvula]
PAPRSRTQRSAARTREAPRAIWARHRPGAPALPPAPTAPPSNAAPRSHAARRGAVRNKHRRHPAVRRSTYRTTGKKPAARTAIYTYREPAYELYSYPALLRSVLAHGSSPGSIGKSCPAATATRGTARLASYSSRDPGGRNREGQAGRARHRAPLATPLPSRRLNYSIAQLGSAPPSLPSSHAIRHLPFHLLLLLFLLFFTDYYPAEGVVRPRDQASGLAMMEGDEDGPEWMMDVGGGGGKGGKGAVDRNKKRFSEEQIKSLESMFATQTKLEPRQKLQLARDLGLQPRQVAIWFQNKRARWKSKQLEREYSALRDDYDALLCSYESLKKEKHALLKQLEKLAEMLQEPGPKYGGNADAGAGVDDGLRKGVAAGMKEEFPDATRAAPSYSVEGGGGGGKFAHFADDDAAGLFRPSPQPSAGFTASGPPDHQPFQFHSTCWPASAEQTCSSSQWWEFESLSE